MISFNSGTLTAPVNSLLELLVPLSLSSFHSLLLLLTHVNIVETEEGKQWGWDPYSQEHLKSLGVGTTAARRAITELRDQGYVQVRRHSATSRQFAVAGPTLTPWFSEMPTADFRKATVHKLENVRGGVPDTYKTVTTSSNSFKETTTKETTVVSELFEALTLAPLSARRAEVMALFSSQGSATSWQKWKEHPTLSPAVGTATALADTIDELVTNPSSALPWCRAHGVITSTLGTELAARIVFALIAATGSERSNPPGWLAHIAKLSTIPQPTAATTKVSVNLRRAAHPAPAPAMEPEPEISTLRIVPDFDVLALLNDAVPSLRRSPLAQERNA